MGMLNSILHAVNKFAIDIISFEYLLLHAETGNPSMGLPQTTGKLDPQSLTL